MNAKFLSILSVLALILIIFLAAVPQGFAQDVTRSYQLVSMADGALTYTLNVVIPQSLTEFYKERNHVSATDGDFVKFVTPYALKPVADCLRSIYSDDETFANEVLTIIHQIPYEVTTPEYYPVETMTMNKGDCDMFSVIAASILKAGGLDVVLLHYASEEHMNIGVHLKKAPQEARLPVYSVKENGVTYYVAESTSSDWQEGWRVGECPEDLQNAPVVVIPIVESSIIAPGQVSASFKRLDPTVLSLSISPSFTAEGSTMTVSGQVYPAVSNQNITLYISANGAIFEIENAVITKPDGSFSYSWKSNDTGTIDVRASWAGNNQYAGTTSEARSSIILPFYLLALVALSIIAIAICITVFALTRKSRSKQNPAETIVAGQNPTPIDPTPPN